MFHFHFGPFKYWYNPETKEHHAELYKENLPIKEQPPVFLQVAVTNYCNLRCSYCYAGSSSKEATQWTEEDLFLVLMQFADAGLTSVAFGGGEPFTIDWFIPLLKRLRKETHLTLSATTNLTRITPEIAKEIKSLDVEIRGSINSLAEYKRRKRGLDILVQNGVKTGINSMLIRENDFLLSNEMMALANKVNGLDILLLEAKMTGRTGLTPLDNTSIKNVISSLTPLVKNGLIKFSSSLSRLFNRANWLFPPQLTRFPGFFGSINHNRQLRHTSFCPPPCFVELGNDPMEAWKEVVARNCQYRSLQIA